MASGSDWSGQTWANGSGPTFAEWSAQSDEEGSSDDEGSSEMLMRGSSPSPPWVLIAACHGASFAHKLLLKHQLQHQYYVTRKTHNAHHKDYKLNALGNQLRGLAQGRHLLSMVNKLEFYLGTPPY